MGAARELEGIEKAQAQVHLPARLDTGKRCRRSELLLTASGFCGEEGVEDPSTGGVVTGFGPDLVRKAIAPVEEQCFHFLSRFLINREP